MFPSPSENGTERGLEGLMAYPATSVLVVIIAWISTCERAASLGTSKNWDNVSLNKKGVVR